MSALPIYDSALMQEIVFWRCGECGRLWNTRGDADNCPCEKSEARLWHLVIYSKPTPRPLLLLSLCRQLTQAIEKWDIPKSIPRP